MNKKMYTLELDIAYDYPEADLAIDCSNYGLEFKLIDPNGPGGGNPVYEFASYNKDDLIAFACVCGYDEKNFGNGTYEIEQYIKEIV